MTDETNNKLVKVSHLLIVKDYIDDKDAKGLKVISVDNSTGNINFYKTEDGTGDPAYTITVADLMKDKYLDTTKTTVVNDFIWSDTTYPGSTNPSLNHKPVVVFAVANGDETIYSFASLEALIDVYTGVDGETANVTVSIDNKITVAVKISAEAGNTLTKKSDGLYVGAVGVSGKADVITEASRKADQILVDDGNGDLKASGKTIAEVKTEVTTAIVGTDTDTKDSATITGAKKYADSLVVGFEFATDEEIKAIFPTT